MRRYIVKKAEWIGKYIWIVVDRGPKYNDPLFKPQKDVEAIIFTGSLVECSAFCSLLSNPDVDFKQEPRP
jgi:hypothetical protein